MVSSYRIIFSNLQVALTFKKLAAVYQEVIFWNFVYKPWTIRVCSRRLYLFLNVRLQNWQTAVGMPMCWVRMWRRKLPTDKTEGQCGQYSVPTGGKGTGEPPSSAGKKNCQFQLLWQICHKYTEKIQWNKLTARRINEQPFPLYSSICRSWWTVFSYKGNVTKGMCSINYLRNKLSKTFILD